MGGKTSLDVIYDTGSDWLVVESSTCDNCAGDRYNINSSVQAGTAKQISSENSERNYGSASLVGKEYTDTVCVQLDNCVTDFRFLLVE